MKSGWSKSRYSVFLDGSLTSAERQAAINGVNMWNQWFTNNGETAPFYLVTYGPGELTIAENSSLGTDPGGIDPTYHWIWLNPMYNARTDGFLTDIMGHEFGHTLGYGDVNDTYCYPYTIMHGGINPTSGSYMTHLGSPDTCALNQNFPPPPPPPPPTSTDLSTQAWCGYNCDPLVLDLDGDGIQTSGADDPVWFDVDGDGKREHVTWTKSATRDGFLYLDLNHHNRVDDGSELFGVGTVMPDGTMAKDGFEALALYDLPQYGGNGDGIIDAQDEVWNHLRVWMDSNHDGVCDPGETGPIHEYGVEEIPLGAVIARSKDPAGNTHVLQGVYMRRVTKNGRSSKVQFAIDSIAFQQVP